MPNKLEFLGAIGRATKQLAKVPGAFKVATPEPLAADITKRYFPYPVGWENSAKAPNIHTLTGLGQRRIADGSKQVLKSPPEFKIDVEEPSAMMIADGEPETLRPFASINAMKAKSADDPDFVPRGYYTLWDWMGQNGVVDRNPYGGVTMANTTRKAPYLQSYLLRKGQLQPQVEMHPTILKASEMPAMHVHGTWNYPELGHDESRYGGLQQLRYFMESDQRPMERDAGGNMLGSYIRNWEKMDHDQQVGALALSEAGSLSRLADSLGFGESYDQALWDVNNPRWHNTLGDAFGRSAKQEFGQYGVGPATMRRALATDYIYRKQMLNPEWTPDLENPDVRDFTKRMFYAKGGRVRQMLSGLKGLGPKVAESSPPVPVDEGRRKFLRQSSALAGRSVLDGIAPGASTLAAQLATKAALSQADQPLAPLFHEAVAAGAPAFYKELAEWLGGSTDDVPGLLNDLESVLAGYGHPDLDEEMGDTHLDYDVVVDMMQRHLNPKIDWRKSPTQPYGTTPYDTYDELRRLHELGPVEMGDLEGMAAGGKVTRAQAALRRIHAAGHKYRPVELYAPIDEQAQLLGRFAYRDPQEAARAGLSSSPSSAVAPLLLRRTPGGSGLFNNLPDAGPVELTDPEGYKLGFAKGGSTSKRISSALRQLQAAKTEQAAQLKYAEAIKAFPDPAMQAMAVLNTSGMTPAELAANAPDSPSRRKFLKQSSAMVGRQLLPPGLEALGTAAARSALTEASQPPAPFTDETFDNAFGKYVLGLLKNKGSNFRSRVEDHIFNDTHAPEFEFGALDKAFGVPDGYSAAFLKRRFKGVAQKHIPSVLTMDLVQPLENLRTIVEDGRAKEAWRSTSISDVFEDPISHVKGNEELLSRLRGLEHEDAYGEVYDHLLEVAKRQTLDGPFGEYSQAVSKALGHDKLWPQILDQLHDDGYAGEDMESAVNRVLRARKRLGFKKGGLAGCSCHG
jgi:hypothetical protein